MGVLTRACPHCGTQHVAFTAHYDWEIRGISRTLFLCGSCQEGVIWETAGPYSPKSVSGDIERAGVAVGRQWPLPEATPVPDDTPPTASRYFEQACSSLATGNFDAAGMMYRKTLEAATKVLDPDLAGKRLIDRIDLLIERNILTLQLGEWAHEVRLGGNEAAHEDEPFTAVDAQILREFTKSFLIYAFTMPSSVARRKLKRIA